MSKAKELQAEKGKSLSEILIEAYDQFGSQARVAEALGVRASTINWWLKSCGLKEKTSLVTAYSLTEAGRSALHQEVVS